MKLNEYAYYASFLTYLQKQPAVLSLTAGEFMAAPRGVGPLSFGPKPNVIIRYTKELLKSVFECIFDLFKSDVKCSHLSRHFYFSPEEDS